MTFKNMNQYTWCPIPSLTIIVERHRVLKLTCFKHFTTNPQIGVVEVSREL